MLGRQSCVRAYVRWCRHLRYLIVMLADWLQGTNMYTLYSSYGVSIGTLFITGFTSSAVFGTVIGLYVDRWGRRFSCIVYLLIEVVVNICEHYNNFTVLLISRIAGGVSTSLLFSAFESWAQCDLSPWSRSCHSWGCTCNTVKHSAPQKLLQVTTAGYLRRRAWSAATVAIHAQLSDILLEPMVITNHRKILRNWLAKKYYNLFLEFFGFCRFSLGLRPFIVSSILIRSGGSHECTQRIAHSHVLWNIYDRAWGMLLRAHAECSTHCSSSHSEVMDGVRTSGTGFPWGVACWHLQLGLIREWLSSNCSWNPRTGATMWRQIAVHTWKLEQLKCHRSRILFCFPGSFPDRHQFRPPHPLPWKFAKCLPFGSAFLRRKRPNKP